MSSLVGDVMTRNVVSVREHAQFTKIILVTGRTPCRHRWAGPSTPVTSRA